MDREQRWPAIGAVAKVVEATFRVDEETAGGGAHTVAIGALDDVGGGGEGGEADGVVFGAGPEAEDNEIGLLGLPPEWVADVRGGRPEDWLFRNF